MESVLEAHNPKDHVGHRAQLEPWGHLPLLCLTSALGVLLLACADTLARGDVLWAEIPFWVGLALIYIPCAVRLYQANLSRRERAGLLVIFTLALYFVKLLHSPVGFTFSDEAHHWRNASNVLQSERLFERNTGLPSTAYYPALPTIT